MRYIRWFCLLALSLPCYAQPSDDFIRREEAISNQRHRVDSLWSQNRIAEAVSILEEMMRGARIQESDNLSAKLLYQLGSGYALLGKTDTAIAILRQLGSLGNLSYMDLAHDAELDHLRRDPRFIRLLDEITHRQMPWQRLFRSPHLFEEYKPNLSCALKVAGLSTLWAEVKYNFAYFDRLPGLDWDSLYLASLPEICATETTFDYYQLLRRIGALLHDGHTAVFIPDELIDTLLYFPAVRTRLIDDTVIVSNVYDPALLEQGVVPGVRIVTIDGMPVHDYAATYVMPYQNASTQQDLLVRTYEHSLLAGACNSSVSIGLVNGDTMVVVRRLDRDWLLEEVSAMHRDAEYRIIGANIGYLTLSTFHDEDLTEVVARNLVTIKHSDALVIDLRENSGGYTIVALNTLKLFMDRPFQTHRWETPRYKPYRRAESGVLEWESEPAEMWPGTGADAYRKPIVILTSAQTYSAAEHFLVAFRHAKRGAIIGERTGGSTGHMLEVTLPGGGAIAICTTRDYFPDGSPFNGIGIEPDVVIRPAVNDVQLGRDAVLYAAIEYLNRLLGRETGVTVSAPYGRTLFSIESGPNGGSYPRLPGHRYSNHSDRPTPSIPIEHK